MADNFAAFPVITNDDGSLTTGTPFSRELIDDVRASIADNVYSATNPTIKTKTIIDDVMAGRGGQASLDARAVLIEADVTALQTLIGSAVGGGGVNWIQNDDFLIWARGDASTPTGWRPVSVGLGQRCGNGLADTNTKVGPFCVRLTRAGANVSLAQYVMGASSFSNYGAHFKGKSFVFGCWVKSSQDNTRVYLYDGDTSTYISYSDGVSAPSGLHPGDGAWHFLSGVKVLGAGATQLVLYLEQSTTDGDAYFSGAVLHPGTTIPTDWIPCPKVYETLEFKVAGNVAVVTDGSLYQHFFKRPSLVRAVDLVCNTAPITTAIILDFNHLDDAGNFVSMFSTLPQIAASAKYGYAAVDGTYRNRCFGLGVAVGGQPMADLVLSADVDQIGTGTVGADLFAHIHYLQYARPHESLIDPIDLAF